MYILIVALLSQFSVLFSLGVHTGQVTNPLQGMDTFYYISHKEIKKVALSCTNKKRLLSTVIIMLKKDIIYIYSKSLLVAALNYHLNGEESPSCNRQKQMC